jgi:hypothetical protein
MGSKPFSLTEAEEIQEDFEDLIDTEFAWGDKTVIVDGLLVCPHPAEEKEAFFEEYALGNDLDDVLDEYSGTEFDVIIAVCDVADESKVSFISIAEYVAEKGITYNFPGL